MPEIDVVVVVECETLLADVLFVATRLGLEEEGGAGGGENLLADEEIDCMQSATLRHHGIPDDDVVVGTVNVGAAEGSLVGAEAALGHVATDEGHTELCEDGGEGVVELDRVGLVEVVAVTSGGRVAADCYCEDVVRHEGVEEAALEALEGGGGDVACGVVCAGSEVFAAEFSTFL